MALAVSDRRPVRSRERTITPPIRPGAVWARMAVTAAAIVAVGGLALSQRPVLARSAAALSRLDWAWVGPAAGVESLSMVAFALVHRRLLRVGGVDVSRRSVTALAFAGNAISSSVPLAGSGLGTAFVFRRFQRLGADRVTAGWVLTVSGVASSLTFGIIVGAGALASDDVAATLAGLTLTLALAAAAAIGVLAMHSQRFRRQLERWALRIVSRAGRMARRPAEDPAATVRAAIQRVASLHLGKADVGAVAGLASLNWLTDAVCLALAVAAVGATVPWPYLILAWAGGATASSVELTPGGIGVVEAAIVGGLVLSGLHAGTATAAVLVYRSMSFWLPVLAGWCLLLAPRPRRSGVEGDQGQPRVEHRVQEVHAGEQEGDGDRSAMPAPLRPGRRGAPPGYDASRRRGLTPGDGGGGATPPSRRHTRRRQAVVGRHIPKRDAVARRHPAPPTRSSARRRSRRRYGERPCGNHSGLV